MLEFVETHILEQKVVCQIQFSLKIEESISEAEEEVY